MKPEWTQCSCISGAFFPFIFRPTSSVRPNKLTRADFWGGSFWSLTFPAGRGRGKVSHFVLRDMPLYLVKPPCWQYLHAQPARTPLPAFFPPSLCCIPSSSACSVLPRASATAPRQPQDLQGQVTLEKTWKALPHGRDLCMEEITTLSLNNPSHHRVKLFTSKVFFWSVCRPWYNTVKTYVEVRHVIWSWLGQGRENLPLMLTWLVIRSCSPHCSLELSWLLLPAVFPDTFFWKIKQFFMPDIFLSWNYFCVQIKSLLCLTLAVI